MKELCAQYVKEKVEKVEVHPKFLAPDGLIRLLIARDYNIKHSFEMFQKWVVSYRTKITSLILFLCHLITLDSIFRTGD